MIVQNMITNDSQVYRLVSIYRYADKIRETDKMRRKCDAEGDYKIINGYY